MKNNEYIERFKAMDSSQKLLVIGVAVSLVTLPFFLMSGGENEESTNEFESFETPENRDEVQEYNSKLEAYQAERSERENVSLEFNIEDFEDDDTVSEEELMEKEIDSLMNQNKRDYASPPSRSSSSGGSGRRSASTSYNRESPPRSERKENVNSGFQDFFSSTPESKSANQAATSQTDPFIYAVIHGDHTIRQGERVKLRLTKKATIAGMDFPENSYIYAFPSFQNNRVLLDINSINHVPVSISAYDTEDSAIGLYVKGAKMVGEVADETSQDAVDEIDVGGVPVGETVKRVFQRKQQEPTVTLLNNTKLILKPNRS
ncbi:conjugative transposon protein TraM [Flagellimonas sp.]|uniref:conjugative transposon protein TraM n=1 Tax=Flagellimonas sp. TaxID=2058762 RepID=UPI003BAA52A2